MSEVDKLKVELYDQKKLAEKYWHEAREGWNKAAIFQDENKHLRDDQARLTKALAWALKHVPKGGTATYACNLANAENALAAALTQAGKGVQGGR